MFVETWRKHWGLLQDPFACEDADKDSILSRMDLEAVHSGFDRLFGDPQSPAPGIVFGEKGSGKSGLRLTMKRRISDYNETHPGGRVFCSEYNDFDVFLEHFRRSVGAKGDPEDVSLKMMKAWAPADHLDAILSLGVTELVDRLLDGRVELGHLPRKQRVDALLLAALYYDSHQRSTEDALRRLRGKVRLSGARASMSRFLRAVGSLLAVVLMLVPLLAPTFDYDEIGPPSAWVVPGALLLLGIWITHFVQAGRLNARAVKGTKSVRVLQRDPNAVRQLLERVPADLREEFVLPKGADEASRFDYLARFQALLASAGFNAWYVLFDRVDEPSLLNAANGSARRFVEAILDHKLLQLNGLALKLFLPIELDEIYRSASPQELKKMRLEKSNLVEKLDWTGQELYEIATRRLRSCTTEGSRAHELIDFFDDDFQAQHLRQTLESVATPRYALGFLAAVFREYARNLPDDLPEESPEWRIPRSHFDVVRTEWLDRSGLLRRKLNT